MKLLEIIMTIVNVIFWICGGTMLGIGIWLAVDDGALSSVDAVTGSMDDGLYAAAVYTMIAVGALVFLVGFLGCCGASRADKSGGLCMLKIYIVTVKIILIAEIVILILMGIFWDSIDDSVRDSMYDDLVKDYGGQDQSLTNAWNEMQVEWKCCGSWNYTDYKKSTFGSVPYTCCVMKDGTNGKDPADVVDLTTCTSEAQQPLTSNSKYTQLYPYGCYKELENFVDDNALIIIIVVSCFMGLQLLGIIFSCLIIKKQK